MPLPRPSSRRRAPRHRVGHGSARTATALLGVVGLLASACGSTDAPVPVAGSAEVAVSGPAAGPGSVVIVLPPSDRLAAAERTRVRMLIDRALDEVIVTGVRPTLLEPATSDALAGAVESAVRRADTVCVLGGGGRAALDAALALYPSRTGCMLPFDGGGGLGVLSADVDLERIGRELGSVARAVAGEGTVLVLDGRDGMLDRRWVSGVIAGAPGANHVVLSADALVQLLDDQAASIADGVVPGSMRARGRSGVADGSVDLDDVPAALALPPVEVVVLDGSAEAEAVVDALLSRQIRVIAPRSLLVDHPDDVGVVLRWRVRWDVPLVALLRRVLDGEVAPGTQDDGPSWELADVLAIDPGPAAPRG